MRVLLSTYGSRGDVEPMVGLAVQLRALGAEVRVCAPPDEEFVELLAGVGVPLVPFGRPWRSWGAAVVGGGADPARGRVHRRAVRHRRSRQPRDVTCSLATGHVALRRAVGGREAGHPAPRTLPSSPPSVLDGPGRPETGTRLFGPPINTHRASIGLPPVDDVREFMFTDQPVAGGGPDPGPVAGDRRPRRRADRRVDPARRTPAPGRAGGVPGRRRTAGVRRFGSMRGVAGGRRPGGHRGGPRAGPPRPRRPRLGRPGPGRRPGRLLRRRRGQPAGAVRPGGRRRAPRRRGHDDDGRPGRCAPGGGAPAAATSRTGPAGWPSWASARRTTARPRPRVPVGRAQDGPGPRDPRTRRPPWPA